MRNRAFPFLLLGAVSLAAEAAALPFRDRPADGGFPGEWLTAFSAGARGAGMGGAATALAGGEAAYANPAGIVTDRSGEAVMMVAPLLFGGQFQAFSISHPRSEFDNMSVSFFHLGSGSAEKTNELGQSMGSFTEQEYAFLLSYAVRAGRTFSAGLTIKAVRQSMAGLSASGFGADAGIRLQPVEGLTAGLSALNLAAPELKLKDGADKFPVFFRAGIAYEHAVLGRPVTFCADAGTFTPSGGRRLIRPGAGVEIRPLSADTPFFLRFGINQREYTAGFSVGTGNFLFDYAASFHELDTTHRFGATFRYEVVTRSDAETIRNERLAALKLEARDWLKAGNPEKSEAAVRSILELDGYDADAAAITDEIRRAREKASEAARLSAAKAAVAAKYADAKELYRSGRYQKALQLLESAPGVSEDDTKAQLLAAMSRAHVLIDGGRYLPAMEQLRKAVELDPDNREAASLYERIRDITGAGGPAK